MPEEPDMERILFKAIITTLGLLIVLKFSHSLREYAAQRSTHSESTSSAPKNQQ